METLSYQWCDHFTHFFGNFEKGFTLRFHREDDIVDLQDQIMNLEQDKEHLQGEVSINHRQGSN